MLPDFPFVYDEYDMPMNTRALASDALIEVTPSYRRELDEKSAILTGDHRYYCQAMADTEPMQWEAVAVLLPRLARHYPKHFSLAITGDRWRWHNHLLGTEACFTLGDTDTVPHADHLGSPLPDPASRVLDWLGRQVQEDLILMSGDAASGTPMVAGHLCFGGSWCLDDKMGKSFLAIHQDVPQFAARIGKPANLIMQRLKDDRPLGRLNWSIAATDRRNMAPCLAHLSVPARRGITQTNAGERCFLRLEWQTLSRLPHTKGILFTIHTTITPLVKVVADPEHLRRLTNVVKGIPRVAREYKGMAGYADALVDYLEARCRAVGGHPPTTATRPANREDGPPAESPATTPWVLRTNASPGEPVTGTPGPGSADILPAPYTRGNEDERGARAPRRQCDDPSWEPWPLDPARVLAGDPVPRVRWLRQNGPDEPWYRAGWLKLAPATLRLPCEGPETYLIEQGRVTITVEDGDPVTLEAGDAISLPRDSVAIWVISEPVRCFFTASK